MEIVKLSDVVLSVSPELYELLTKEELESDVVVQGKLTSLDKVDIQYIVGKAIAYHHRDEPYH